jgi:hypothetical protein
MTTRRITAIAVHPDGVYAAADDGTFWYRSQTFGWTQLGGLPQPAPTNTAESWPPRDDVTRGGDDD